MKRGGPQTSRHVDDDGVHHPSRRHPLHRPGRGRPDLSRRAVRAVDHLHLRSRRPARCTENCTGSSFAENGGRDRHWVPHFLPGQNSGIGEFLKTQTWIPFEPVRGGVKTIYPEYRGVIGKSAALDTLTVPASKSANDVAKRIADQSPRDGQVHVMPVQGNIYMLVADGTNITASVGRDGIAIVNTGSAQMSDKVLAALTELAETAVSAPATNNCFGANCPGMPSWSSPYFNTVVASPRPARPMRYVINTSAAPEHVGGNEKLAASGGFAAAASADSAAPCATSARRRRSSPTRTSSTAMSTPPARPGGSGRSLAGGHVLRRVPQAVRIRQRRAGDPLSAPRPPTPTATASCSSATRK